MSVWRSATIGLLGLGLTGVVMIGCGGGETEGAVCEGRQLTPHLSPVSFGEMYPLGNRDPDLLSPERSPFEWVLLLQSPCAEEVKIDEVCLIGDTASFVLEGPEPTTAKRGREAALRLTYERQDPHTGNDSDQVALVVQSNAENTPTLVIPVCARIVEDGVERGELECESPVTVQPGEKVADLCSG